MNLTSRMIIWPYYYDMTLPSLSWIAASIANTYISPKNEVLQIFAANFGCFCLTRVHIHTIMPILNKNILHKKALPLSDPWCTDPDAFFEI